MLTIDNARAPAVLRQAAVEVTRRLQGAFLQGFTESGSPDIKPQDERHHCRHKYRVVFREGIVFLTRSKHPRCRLRPPNRVLNFRTCPIEHGFSCQLGPVG